MVPWCGERWEEDEEGIDWRRESIMEEWKEIDKGRFGQARESEINEFWSSREGSTFTSICSS